MKNVRKIIMVIIGASIGAGFASGREIYTFFFRYGKPGILGIIISSIITGLTIYFTLKISYEKEIDNYDEFINEVNSKRKKENVNKNINKKINRTTNKKDKKNITNKLIKSIVIIFLLISFFIMIAGFSAYIKQIYGIEIYISSTFFVLIVYIVLLKNAQGMLKFNDFLVPVIIILILFLGIKNIPLLFNNQISIVNTTNEINHINQTNIINQIKNNSWFLYSILYASFNNIVLIPVVITIRKYIVKKEEIGIISIISTNIFIVLALCIYGLLLKAKFNIEEVEMPILEVLDNSVFKFMYGIVIIFAIFTSAISVGYSFLENISSEKYYKRNLIIICVIGISFIWCFRACANLLYL